MNLEGVEEAYWPSFPQRNHSALPFNRKGQRNEMRKPASLTKGNLLVAVARLIGSPIKQNRCSAAF